MENLVQFLVSALTEKKEEVKVTVEVTEEKTVYRVEVAQEDIGRVIGKQGKTIQAIRQIVKSVGAKSGVKAFVDIADGK